MADLIQNMQNVYKKWESRAPYMGSRGRRRDLQHNTGDSRRGYGRSGYQMDSRITYDRPGERKFKQRSRTPHFKLPKYDGLAQFKMAPCVVAENKQRPYVGACCAKCLPVSRGSVLDKSVFSLSVCNVLQIPHFQSFDINLVLNVLKKNQRPLYPDVSINVQSERIQEAVEKNVEDIQKENDFSDELGVLRNIEYNRAKNILESLKTSVSSICLQISSFILHYFLDRISEGILVHKGQIEILKAASQENIPIIYLPVHRSNLDCILISFILYMNSMKVPLVATDYDLYIPLFSWFTRFLGAFYIRRRLESEKRKKDFVLSAVIENFLTDCLKAGHNLEFFIESERSRSGKPQIPTGDLLSFVVDSVVEESVEDVCISTVSISYERIMEGNFASEQLGETKTQDTFLAKLYGFWKMLHFNLGNIRINFGQPFSLQEFLQTYQQKIPGKLPDTPPSSPTHESSHEYEHKTHTGTVVSTLAQHIIYDATCATSLMSTHLVSFLFVTQYRKGATQQQLQSSLDWLCGELTVKKRNAGFTGESLPVIKRAVDLLGRNLITSETIDMEWTSSDLENNNVKVTVYKPVTQLPHVLELQYYANHVVPVFLMDSMIVNALYALVDVEICHFRHCDSRLFVFRDKVVEKAVELSEMLQFEFVAVPPCVDIAFSFNDILDELVEKECLHTVGMQVMPHRSQYSRSSHPLSFDTSEDDDEDCSVLKQQQLKIDLTEESINHFEFLRCILSPYIESYWLAAITLLKLINEIKEESILIQEMQLTAQEKLYKGLLAYEESFSADTFKNALRLFEQWRVVEHYLQDGIKIVYLNDCYNCKERINDVISRIEEFRK